jgi:hypothetical protein
LACSPRWHDFHRLAWGELEAETSKFAAADAHDFERAAVILQLQMRLEDEHAADFKRLVIELVDPEPVESPGSEPI